MQVTMLVLIQKKRLAMEAFSKLFFKLQKMVKNSSMFFKRKEKESYVNLEKMKE